MIYYTCNFNNHPLYQQVIDRNIKAGFDLTVLTKPTAPHKYTNLSATHLCDIERFWLLKNNPYAVYIDADTVILRDPDFKKEPGMPYFYGMNSCVMVGNGASDFFDLIFQLFDGINHPCYYFEVLKTRMIGAKYRFIPGGYFRHLALGVMQMSPPEEGGEIGGNGYSVKKINGELILRIGE